MNHTKIAMIVLGEVKYPETLTKQKLGIENK